MFAFDSTVLSDRLVSGTVGAAAILATTVAYYTLNFKDEEHDFPKLRGIQLYHAWNFFQRRYDFLHLNFNGTPEGASLSTFSTITSSL